jgi:hypothetical protein
MSGWVGGEIDWYLMKSFLKGFFSKKQTQLSYKYLGSSFQIGLKF